MAAATGGWEAEAAFAPHGTALPYGAHVAEVECDPEIGATRLLGYSAVQDCGVPVSARVVAEQLHGGVAQDVGQALLERSVIEPASGQLLSASFMDCALPPAADLASVAVRLHAVPSPLHPLGAKPVGEAGPTAAPPALVNAICDALGLDHVEMPATPERVWRAARGSPA